MTSSYSRLLSVARRGCKFNRPVSKQVHIFEFLCFFAPCQMAVRPLSRLWSSFRQQMAEEEAHAARTMVNWRRVVCNVWLVHYNRDKFPTSIAVAICVHPSCVLSHMEACHRQDLKHIQFNHPYHSWFMVIVIILYVLYSW